MRSSGRPPYKVLAAWLHAAALDPHVELSDLREWLETSNTAVPAAILDAAGIRAEPTAKTNMLTHLDPAAERTTSGVKRYVSFALASVTSGDGQRLCGSRREAQFDMESFILAGGTLYVLAQNERMASARPVLSMFANEVFTAAENAALRLPARRLSEPFIGVIDELRYGVRYIYAAQSSAQEEQLYGEHAARELRDAAGLSIHGGFDTASASGVTDRAGRTSVVTAGRGHDGQSHESVELQEALSVADQQQLADGESVILASGIKVFLAHTDAYYEHRRQRRRIGREAAAVTARVARARDGQNAWTEAAVQTEHSGAYR